jgi:hypothetical protein
MRGGGGYKRDTDGDFLEEVYKVEREPKCHVYTRSSNRKVICGMGGAAKDIFLYVLFKLEYGKDWIWLNRSGCMNDSGIKAVVTYDKGIEELVRCGVLSLVFGYDDVFWINPVYLFNGSRVKKFPSNVRVEYDFMGGERGRVKNGNKEV